MSMARVFTYKGYTGSIELSVEDNCLYGKILGITDLISYEGYTISELRGNFENAVDEYLDFCSEIGKEPQREYKGTFNVRISPELHKKAAIEAARENQTLNWIVGRAMELYLCGNGKAR